jgi:molybdopterin molybdotransferase
MMDGYAVRRSDAGKAVAVVAELAAGQAAVDAVEEGHCLEIMTGAPCPAGTEAVVPKEDVKRQGAIVVLPQRIASGQHIAPQGSECRSGQAFLAPGSAITPLAVAALASIGRTTVCVIPLPSLAVITTGAELVPADQAPGQTRIRDSNGPMLAALADTMGRGRPRLLHADDRLEAILAALEEVRDRDIILLSGGVSTGNYDASGACLWRRFGFSQGQTEAWKAAPVGKPRPTACLRPARQSAGLPFLFSPLRGGGCPADGRPADRRSPTGRPAYSGNPRGG